MLVWPAKLGLSLLGDVDAPAQVPAAELSLLTSDLQLLQGVLADRFEQAVAALALLRLEEHQRFGHQLRQQVEHVGPVDLAAAADLFGGVEREAAGEHGEPPQEDTLRLGEQGVAPVDGGT